MKNVEPDLAIAGFSLWVHAWEREESADFDDRNWLVISACQLSTGSSVRVERNALFQSTDFVRFLLALEDVYEKLSGEAMLEGHEPYLRLVLRAMARGHVEMFVQITPDVVNEEHSFRSEIDQSYLLGAISDVKRILTKYHPRP